MSWFDRTDNASGYSFYKLANKLESCREGGQQSKSNQEKLMYLFDEDLKSLLAYQSMYPILRLLLPNVNSRRYDLKDASLARIYINILVLAVNSTNWLKLNNFKPNSGEELPTLIADMIPNTTPSNKTIGDVNNFLDRIVGAAKNEKEAVFRDVCNSLSALEQKWFLRFIIGSGKQAQGMGVGFKQDSVFRFLHLGAKDQYDTQSSLVSLSSWLAKKYFESAKEAKEQGLKAGGEGRDKSQIMPGNAFQVAVAKRPAKGQVTATP